MASELLGALEHADYVSPWGWGGEEIQSWANLNFSSTNNHTRTQHGIMCAVVIGELAKQDITNKRKVHWLEITRNQWCYMSFDFNGLFAKNNTESLCHVPLNILTEYFTRLNYIRD